MSVSLDTPGAIVFKSAGTGANGKALTVRAPDSLAADTAIMFGAKPFIFLTQAQIAANPTLLSGQSGSLVYLEGGGAAGVITLPNPVGNAGVNFEFVLSANNAAITAIRTGAQNTSLAKGICYVNNGGAPAVTGNILAGNVNHCNFTATALAYDRLICISNGTNWVFTGFSGNSAGFSFSNTLP